MSLIINNLGRPRSRGRLAPENDQMDVLVSALKGFDHYGSRHRGEQFRCSRQVALRLAAKGLVEIPDDQPPPENPTGGAGTQSSASPAGPASQQTTSNESGAGETEKPPDSENPPATEPETPPDPVPETKTRSKKKKKGGR